MSMCCEFTMNVSSCWYAWVSNRSASGLVLVLVVMVTFMIMVRVAGVRVAAGELSIFLNF